MNLKYIDLFCGAGGLGEGFTQANIKPVFHIDSNQWALETVRLREIYYYLKSKNKINEYYKYLRKTNGPFSSKMLSDKFELNDFLNDKILHEEISNNNIELILNKLMSIKAKPDELIIIGGPPCQAYSLGKRSRMRYPTHGLRGRALTKADGQNKKMIQKHLNDKRHSLYAHYLKIIHKIKPSAFVYENVPGILTAKNNDGEIIKLLSKDLNQKAGGYCLIAMNPAEQQSLKIIDDGISFKDFIIDASDYGIPQKRKRFILIGIQSKLLKHNNHINIFHNEISKYKNHILSTVDEAISDLPKLKSGEGENYFLNKQYRTKKSKYSIALQNINLGGILNHAARKHMDSDLMRYKYFVEFSKIHKKNATLYNLAIDNNKLLPNHRSAKDILNKKNQKNLKARYVDRFKVQLNDQPSSTITAHIAKDGHAFIHPSIKQNRSLTVREAARLQSFPDDYAFCGPRTEQYKQVGNAVPVILAKIIANGIKKVLSV